MRSLQEQWIRATAFRELLFGGSSVNSRRKAFQGAHMHGSGKSLT